MDRNLIFRKLQIDDCLTISEAFKSQGWDKPSDQYKAYLQLQKEGKRDILVAEVNGDFAGYLTIQWDSEYPPFRKKKIPKIVDLIPISIKISLSLSVGDFFDFFEYKYKFRIRISRSYRDFNNIKNLL